MKRICILFIVLAGIFLTSGMAFAENPKGPVLIVRGDNNFPPYEFIDPTGKAAGFDVDLIRAVAREMGLKIRIDLGPWNTVRQELEAGKIDIITGMIDSRSRQRRIDFSVPLKIVSQSVFVRKGSQIHSLAGTAGKEIIVQKGDIMDDYIREHHLTQKIIEVENPSLALKLLASGAHDCALLARIQGLYLIRKEGLTNLVPVGKPFYRRKYCFAVPKGDTELLAKLNEGLFALKTRGVYDEIYQKWFGIYTPKDLWGHFKYYFIALAVVMLLLGASLLWTYSLRKKVARRTRALEQKVIDQKRTETALKESENRFNLAVKASSVGLWNWDDIQQDRVWWSPQIYDMLGYTPDEIDPSFSRFMEQMHPDDIDNAKRAIANHLKYRSPYDIEYRLRQKKGAYRWFRALGQAQWDENGTAVRMAGSIQDITALKRSEAYRIQLATVVEQTEEGIVITDIDGKIRYINPAFAKMSGYETSEIMGSDFLRLKSEPGINPDTESIRQLLLTGKAWKGRLVYRFKGESTCTVDATISPIRDGSGRVTNFVAVNHDITRQIELENRLRQSQKLEAIGTLAGGIAHDFNNILYVLIGYTELAMTDIDPDSQLHHNLNEVLTSAWRARDLVRQILTFSRKSDQSYAPVKIKPVVREVMQLIRATLPASIDICQEIDSESFILGDSTQIHQVITNLCTNAGHAMLPGGGILTVRLEDVMLTAEFTKKHIDIQPGMHVKLSVTDTGSGIPENIRERIFEPFFTTKDAGKGSGLGLSVVHGIVKAHRGAISVNSSEGKGTTFDIYIPVTEGEDSPELSSRGALPGGSERIMIVDDEKALVDMGKQMLAHLGYSVTAFTDPLEAMDRFCAEPERYDLIITDMTMPKLTGYQLAAAAKDTRPGIPVILISGYNEQISEESFTAIGVNEFMLKPIPPKKLAYAIRRILDETPVI